MVATNRRKWLALGLLSTVQFMVVLGFSERDLQWVISAYALVFGGFLLLGGRAADVVGRRRMFLAGLVVFTLASLLAGLAWSEPSLIAARALQGLGAAVISPAALSILSTTFTEGRERNIALGVWGAVGGFGAAAGVLLGGILTSALSWSWIFFVNVPVGAAAFVLLAAFVWWERRHAEPLMRFGILRTKTVAGANVGGLILGTATFSMFLMLTLYMQQVLGYSPLKTGVAYLAVAVSAIVWSGVAAQLTTRIGVKPVLVAGRGRPAPGRC